MAISVVSSLFSQNQGPCGLSLSGTCSHPSILSPTGLQREGVEDRTEQHIDPHSYDHQRCVFLVLSTRGLGAQPLWDMLAPPLWDMFSSQHLLTNWSPNSLGVPRAPSVGVVAFSNTSPSGFSISNSEITSLASGASV